MCVYHYTFCFIYLYSIYILYHIVLVILLLHYIGIEQPSAVLKLGSAQKLASAYALQKRTRGFCKIVLGHSPAKPNVITIPKSSPCLRFFMCRINTPSPVMVIVYRSQCCPQIRLQHKWQKKLPLPMDCP